MLITLVLPHFPMHEGGAAVTALLGYPAAALLLLAGHRFPAWMFHVLLGFGTLVVSVGIYFGEGGTATAAGASFYVWVALYAFHFFDWAQAAAHLVLVALAYAGVLWLIDGVGREATQQWLLLVGTAVVAGLVVGSLARQVRALARVDDLTGLINRRGWEETLVRELARARREHYPLCVALVDLDHFKELNDQGGHAAGDRFLEELARRWTSQVRDMDVLGRYGGDEFAVILPRCTLGQADEVVWRMRGAMDDGHSFSAGLAMTNGDDSPDGILARADAALYEAKRRGRARTEQAV